MTRDEVVSKLRAHEAELRAAGIVLLLSSDQWPEVTIRHIPMLPAG